MEENIDNLPENIHGALVDTASEIRGKDQKKKKPWMTNGILDPRDRRRSLKNRIQEGPSQSSNQKNKKPTNR